MSQHDKLRQYNETVEIPVKLWAAREHARGLIVACYTDTWSSTGGVPYRKTGVTRQMDRVKADEACKFLADYLDQGMTREAVWRELVDEAIAKGELIRDSHGVHSPQERDRTWVESLTVRSIT